MTLSSLSFPQWVEVMCVVPSENIYIADTLRRMKSNFGYMDLVFRLLVSNQLIERDASVQINKRIVTYHLTKKGRELQSLLVQAKKLV